MGLGLPERLGIVVGLEAEARIARRLTRPGLVAVSGATAAGARLAADTLLAAGVDALMSFGLAAGLDPTLVPGTVLVPRAVRVGARELATTLELGGLPPDAERRSLLHSSGLVTTPAAKAALFGETKCVALDMESGVVAEAAMAAGRLFTVLRAICDPAGRFLPAAAALPLGPGGRVSGVRVAGSILRQPWQVPELIRLGGDAKRGMRALQQAVFLLRPNGRHGESS